MTHGPVLLVVAPLATAVICSVTSMAAKRATRYVLLTGLLVHAGLLVLVAVDATRTAGLIYLVGGWAAPAGIVLVVDRFAALFLVLLAIGEVALTLYTIGKQTVDRSGFAVLLALLATALSGVIVAGDLFNMFVFIELASVASIGLIALKRRDTGAASGFVYLVYASISGALFLIAVVVLYSSTGVLTIAEIGAVVHTMPPEAIAICSVCFIVSFGVKVGLVPLHFWQAPAYHAAGSTAAAFLSGVAMKVYLYAMVRLLWSGLDAVARVPAIAVVLTVAGLVNIVFGHLVALGERDLKRLLAYSSVAHVGYILLGLGSSAGMVAALMHIVMHSLMKTGLFFSCRPIIAHSGSSRISRLAGTARAQPVAFAAFVVAALAIVGIPPTGGFASKWFVSIAAYADYGVLPVLVVAVGTVISLLYYVRVSIAALAEAPPLRRRVPSTGRAGATALVVIASIAAATLILGPAMTRLEPTLRRAADSVVDRARYIDLVRGPTR
ncbi:MAG: hypothetical protein EA382_17060 [Spirochaetaceae bacterium]|nr:MAG: hypothetical protein EA382_17060 [Spirochaetaceae bacterium]